MGAQVFNIEWQGCGALSSETIKLSPRYFCGGTTEGFLSSPVALVMMRFEVSQPLCCVCNQNSRLHLQLLLSCSKYVHVEVLRAHVVHMYSCVLDEVKEDKNMAHTVCNRPANMSTDLL